MVLSFTRNLQNQTLTNKTRSRQYSKTNLCECD